MPALNIVRYGSPESEAPIKKIRDRFGLQLSQASAVATEKTVAVFGEALTPVECVRRIIEAVRDRGDEGLLEFAFKLDGLQSTADQLRIPASEIESAPARIDPALLETLRLAASNIRRFQEHIRIPVPPMLELGDRQLGVVYRPLDSTGIYIPGGSAAYPSTVLMTAIPAAVAGVKRIAMVCLPGPDGKALPEILAAAKVAGVTEIYKVGGPHAIAALAFGTGTIPRVDKIVGPGNLFVTIAKREILGMAGIDMLAGPSEVIVLADETANPAHVAADLLAQAEHDPIASAVLVTPSASLASAVQKETDLQLANLPRAKIAGTAIHDYGLAVVVNDMNEGIDVVNQLAPEHLEIIARDEESILAGINNAGAIFLGPHTPEPVGDYVAGPSHVLPTGGTARFFSGLSVNDFLKRTSLLRYQPEALKAEADHVTRFAYAEGLDAHARSIEIRQNAAD
ncbi:MAG: histidinol dehydrogenase [Planctomycetota bacterium]|nr:histidinol dehydrogenase [Planctomycetota bacterium]MDA1137547.1 histidinol dehydrogenase [Planctomycetota bacterium]